MSVKSSNHGSEKMRKCAPSEKGAFCLPPNGVCAGGAGRTQSTLHVTYQQVRHVKGRAQKVRRGETTIEKGFSKGGGRGMERACVAEHQEVFGLNNDFLTFSI